MTNDQFTEWLTNRFLFYRRRKNDLLLSEKERIQAEAKETECADCIYQYRSLAPTWIPVTPDTMPPKDEWVIACTKHWTGVAKLRDLDYDDGITYEWEDETSEWVTGILAWMPRPAPYVPPAPPTK